MNNNEIREEEKRVFLRAFYAYIYPFVEDMKTVTVVKSKNDLNVEFVFLEKNGVKTTRHFDDDMLFAYSIAVEAIKEEAPMHPEWHTCQDLEGNLVLTIRN